MQDRAEEGHRNAADGPPPSGRSSKTYDRAQDPAGHGVYPHQNRRDEAGFGDLHRSLPEAPEEIHRAAYAQAGTEETSEVEAQQKAGFGSKPNRERRG